MQATLVGTAGGSGTSWSLATASPTPVPPIPLGDPFLDAAVRYFGTHGLRSPSLEDIARSGDLDLRELRGRYPSWRSLVVGIFERMLTVVREQLDRQLGREAMLTERLQRWFQTELQLLEPCKTLVQTWLVASADPLSVPLQGPLAVRYVAQVRSEFELAHARGEISRWVLPAVAAGAFIALRGSLVLSWLGDDSPQATRTLTLARAEIAAFVRLLAPWPGLEKTHPSITESSSVPEPRALSAPIEVTGLLSGDLSPPTATFSLAGESTTEAAQSAVAQSAVAQSAVAQTTIPPSPIPPSPIPPTVTVSAAIAQAPVILGELAQTTAPAPEPQFPLQASEPARSDSSAPPPAKPGDAKRATHPKHKSRKKGSKH